MGRIARDGRLMRALLSVATEPEPMKRLATMARTHMKRPIAIASTTASTKAGFLRSSTSLIQSMGRAARNVNARVIMFADEVTAQMQVAIDETERRRVRQLEHNRAHGITPNTIRKAIRRGLELELRGQRVAREALSPHAAEKEYDREELIGTLEAEMLEAARGLEFERAATLRDQIAELKAMPEYGDSNRVTLHRADPGARPGAARSRAGITGRSRSS